MRTTTIRLPESLYDNLKEEADEQEMSVSGYIRRVLQERGRETGKYANTSPNTAPNTPSDTSAYSTEHDTDATPNTSPNTAPNTAEYAELDDRVSELEERMDAVEGGVFTDFTDEADAVEPQGESLEDRLLAYVRANEPVTKSDVEEAFEDEWQEMDIKPRSWWLRHARPVLKESGATHERNRGWFLEE